jgi:hypothetical protein
MLETMIATADGHLIDYHILPVDKRVQLVPIRNEVRFAKILSENRGELIPVNYTEMEEEDDVDYWQLTRIFIHAKIYRLHNKLLVIDQWEVNKALPYYLCNTLRDYKLISKYLSVARPDGFMKHTVRCNLYGDRAIRKFLSIAQLELFKDRPKTRERIYLTKDRQCVYLVHDGESSDYYYNLTIYKSPEHLYSEQLFIDPEDVEK